MASIKNFKKIKIQDGGINYGDLNSLRAPIHIYDFKIRIRRISENCREAETKLLK